MVENIDTVALLNKVDIVSVIDRLVPLKKSGAEYKACCPFHTESTPSFTVSPSKQFYNCFGCGAHGDAIKFVQEYHGLSFVDACKALGDGEVVDGAAPVRREIAREKRESPWTPILPPPADAPEPPKAHVVRGQPEMVWCYPDQAGMALGYVYRFKTSDGGKETLPLVWCRHTQTGEQKWHWMAFPEPRPLYGLDRLAAKPAATVLLVEGEKCADAGHAELPDLAVVSWPGGGKAVKKVDWTPLAGRKVILWADADAKRVPLTKAEKDALPTPEAVIEAQANTPLLPEDGQPGVKTMTLAAELLHVQGCKLWSVKIPAPGKKADGWDIADAIEEGLTGEALAAFIRDNISLLAVAGVGGEALQADSDDGIPPPVPATARGGADDNGPPRRRRVAASAGAVATPAGAFVLSEDSLAQRFEAEWKGTLVFAHKFGYWLIRDRKTGIWARDHTERVFHWLREFIRHLNSEQQAKWSKAAVVASVERFARAAPSFARTGDEFDANNWLLGTPAGVVDLRTGEAVEPSSTDYVSKRTSVPIGAGTPSLWLAFLEQATKGDADLVGYLQRLCGYCLTGETSEEVLVFMHGPGGNGKGVFMGALRDIMGEYARQAPMQVFLANNGDRHPTELANLHGARLVLGSESPEGKRWDEERIKSLTGRDAISARFMNRDFFEFVPRFKLLVASNHKPRIRTVDDAWRRRLHLVPFTVKPEKPDPNLKDRLRAEYPAILNWMVAGAEWWSREGLCPPATILDATEEYFREEDVIGLWFDECCEPAAPPADTERKCLYQSFENWCHGMGHAAANMHTVTRWFKQRGYEQASKKATRPIIGVRLRVAGGAE